MTIRKKAMDELSIVHNALKVAKKYDLETEVVLYALYNMKDNPEQTLQEALASALGEWIK